MRISDWSSDVCSSDLLRGALKQVDHERPPRVLFSAHGLPKKIVDQGDPYQWQVEQSVAAVLRRLGEVNLDWQICYQSRVRSEEHTSELQSLMRISYAVFCLKKKKKKKIHQNKTQSQT